MPCDYNSQLVSRTQMVSQMLLLPDRAVKRWVVKLTQVCFDGMYFNVLMCQKKREENKRQANALPS